MLNTENTEPSGTEDTEKESAVFRAVCTESTIAASTENTEKMPAVARAVRTESTIDASTEATGSAQFSVFSANPFSAFSELAFSVSVMLNSVNSVI